MVGDIDLNLKLNELENHFKYLFKKMYIIQVPHHGAKRNWNRQILNNFKYYSFWIISAGISNKYGFPDINVIDDILFHKKGLMWCNEHHEISFHGELLW